MIFQEPKVEFIKMQLAGMITDDSNNGNQSTITQCDGEVYHAGLCSGGEQFNY